MTHGGGDPIVDDGTDSLSIELWDKRTAYLWAWNQADRTLADFPIEDGDSVTVDVSRGEHIKTQWTNYELNGWTLAEYDVP